jgi:NFU1 iron-sulfur cluster scaffold homolog, mitochondrial
MPEVLFAEPTPNENAMKFTLRGKAIESGSATFKKGAATDNPTAKAVLAIDGIVAVFLLNDFVTVTKEPSASWATLQQVVTEAINGA